MSAFIKANLVSLRTIDVMVFTDAYIGEDRLTFSLFQENEYLYSPTIIRRTSMRELMIFRLELKEQFDFSKHYYLSFMNFPIQLVDVSMAVDFKEFDLMFYYDGDDLGATYGKEETTFKVWAPLSPLVKIKIENAKGEFEYHTLTRLDRGVHAITLKGDYKNRKYRYVIENNGVVRESYDIYGKSSSLNSVYSSVVDIEEIKQMGTVPCASSLLKPVDSIIYEVSIRDFTEGKDTDIQEKGKYLGFVEEGRKTKCGHPAGIDYLSYLGVTHVQLLPVHDVVNVPDDNVKAKYNWGYDPASYFVLEGAYSSDPGNPTSRNIEFKTLVNKLHKRNIAVNVDVVYNHVFEWFYTSYERTVPGYFFRKKKNGELSSCSGCGNDFASERKMARKLIVDSVKYLFEIYDIDGLRFDLMGLLDITTMREIEAAVRKIKPTALLYGEGWNMGLQIPVEERACHDNADKLPGYGFFNDMYRDIIKGPTFKDRIKEKGFINGDLNYYFGLEYIMNGSVLDMSYQHRFLDANQSLNYAECHDNNTLFDKLAESNSDEDVDTLYRRIRLANDIILTSFGMPFFHMGQEIGQSKSGLDNTYNVTKINNMNWSLVDQNFFMVEHLRKLIIYRKTILKYLSLYRPEDIKGVYTFHKLDNGLVVIDVNSPLMEKYPGLKIIINNSNDKKIYEDGDYYSILEIDKTEFAIQRVPISPAKLIILYKNKN
ncbi:MAG: type I pullulanase [Bacilli bacterium]|nr:type I pullulanase [Bacilli bacterium]